MTITNSPIIMSSGWTKDMDFLRYSWVCCPWSDSQQRPRHFCRLLVSLINLVMKRSFDYFSSTGHLEFWCLSCWQAPLPSLEQTPWRRTTSFSRFFFSLSWLVINYRLLLISLQGNIPHSSKLMQLTSLRPIIIIVITVIINAIIIPGNWRNWLPATDHRSC